VLTNIKTWIQLCILMLLTACQTITYTASCRVGDTACQRNQDAQTLALIGHKEAATELMCSDSSFSKSDICTGTSSVR
jgi:hypothetical protein